MYITELSIKRPVVAAVFSMILVVFGLFVFSKLPVRELPSGLQPPVVQIQVDYQGASAEVISSEVTEIIEDVIGGAAGIKNIDSTSENGRCRIKIEFETNINLDSETLEGAIIGCLNVLGEDVVLGMLSKCDFADSLFTEEELENIPTESVIESVTEGAVDPTYPEDADSSVTSLE